MHRIAALILVLILAAVPAGARTLGETEIVNEAALAKLKNNKGVTLSGTQGPHNGDKLTVEGVVTRIEARKFWLKGRIVIVDNETNQPCVREGIYTFRITGARRFWRLKEQEARCPGRADLTDYVDVRF